MLEPFYLLYTYVVSIDLLTGRSVDENSAMNYNV